MSASPYAGFAVSALVFGFSIDSRFRGLHWLRGVSLVSTGFAVSALVFGFSIDSRFPGLKASEMPRRLRIEFDWLRGVSLGFWFFD